MELLTIIIQSLVLIFCIINAFLSHKLQEKNAKNAWIVALLGWEAHLDVILMSPIN